MDSQQVPSCKRPEPISIFILKQACSDEAPLMTMKYGEKIKVEKWFSHK
jgi:hypothetical protein